VWYPARRTGGFTGDLAGGSGEQPQRLGSAGFTAVEVLVACVIGGLALGAAWSWFFTLASAAGGEERRLEAETSLAFVTRLTASELRRASALLSSPAPGCSAASVEFLVPHADGTTETIVYVWNPATRVLWRKASGSHLASGVAAFSIDYIDAKGIPIEAAGGSLTEAQLARVRRLRFSIALASGRSEVRASWDVTPRARR
jgi:hypothetical protein